MINVLTDVSTLEWIGEIGESWTKVQVGLRHRFGSVTEIEDCEELCNYYRGGGVKLGIKKVLKK